jgi:PEP-CTERM motif
LNHRTLPFARWAVSAAVLACASIGSAHAAASSSASLTDLTITLYDLNFTDGVTPSITFAGNSYTYSWAYSTSPYEAVGGDYHVGTSPFDPSTHASSTSQSTASASSIGSTPTTITGTTTVVGGLQTSGSANGTAGSLGNDYSQYAAQAWWNGWSGDSFTLSANTAVVFSATAATSAVVTTGYSEALYNWEYAQGYASLYAAGPGASGNGSQSSFDSLQSYLTNQYNSVYDGDGNFLRYSPGSDSKSGTLGAAFVNFTGGSMSGTFYAYAGADGHSYAAAVPEPETYAMLLAGLSVIGMQARRRRRD